jgi:CIC family chloride channel protein
VTGIGAVLFRELIGLLHNLFLLFAGRFAFAYDANEFTAPSRRGAFVILAPVVGGVIVTFLVSNFAPEAKATAFPK